MCLIQNSCPKYDFSNPQKCEDCIWLIEEEKKTIMERKAKVKEKTAKQRWLILLLITYTVFVISTVVKYI